MKYVVESEDKMKDLQHPSGQGAIIQNSLGVYTQVYLDDDNFLADRFHRKIKSEMEWFETIIRHSPTVGSFYENLLRTTLKDFAPSSNLIGTGFVFDTTRKKHGKQIDVLIYDDSDRSVIYRCDEFVVIHPSSVISTIEVKKTLNSTTLKEVVRSTFFNNLGQSSEKYKSVQNIKIFAYRLQCKKETICKALTDVLEECIESLRVSAEGKDGYLPISYCTLPEVYFLDENFYLETKLVKNSNNLVSLAIYDHKAPNNGSIGALLESSIKENRSKVLEHEKNFLQNILRRPPTIIEVNGLFSLIDIIPYNSFVINFADYKMELANLEINGYKPVNIMVSKGIKLNQFIDPNDFFNSSSASFELFKYDEMSSHSMYIPASKFKI